MPTTSTSDDPDRKATSSPLSAHTSTPLNYAVTHVFLPVELPERTDYTLENEHSLARAVCAAAHAYGTHVCGTSEQAQWHLITKMLDNLQASVQSEHMDNDHVISQLRGMQTGDILAFFVRRQNAAIILTKRENCMLCEAFEVSPSGDAVMETLEPLACSYPGSAVETPSEVFDNGDFQFELANFISRPNAADSDLPLPPPTDPQYINALFNGVLQNVDRATDEVPRVTKHTALLTGPLDGVGRPADASRIMKRVRDHVGLWFRTSSRPEDTSSWHRSLLWLLIRVAIQTSVNRSPARASYKRFVLFFICTFARDESNTTLSSDLLHLMLSKILRRLSKLGSSTPDWLSEVAVGTCTCLRGVLDARWEQLNARPSPFRNPSQDELTRDTQLSLLHSGEYIRNALANPGPQLDTPFHPSHRRRGTIEEFLSSNGTFFDEAYAADPNVTLYDVEKLVEEGIDDWFACVTNVDEACVQLEILMDKYMTKICELKSRNPEDMSTRLLTAIELYVALDKLVVKEIPMLADYSPEIPIACLGTLLLRKKTSLHRLSCAYQYLSARHSQSRLGWSVLSNEFTKDSFPVRYYDQSPRFQLLKARIEEDAVKKIAGQASPQLDGASLLCSPGECQEYQISRRRLAESEEVSHSPLPALLLHAKVVVFELQCPACVHSWRSAAPRILHHFWNHISIRAQPIDAEEQNHLLARVPALQAYLVERREPPLRHQIHFAYFYPEASQSRNHPMLRYVFRYPRYSLLDSFFRSTTTRDSLSIWQSWRHQFDEQLSFKHRPCLPHWHRLKKYVNCTFHTPNDVMSAQADCPADLSLDEFIAFAHLRSGGSLQWLNILQGLRSRTLNLRRHQVHSLLTYAALEVGPLDLNAGTWIWHQELQDSFFCNALLDELDSLIMGVRAQSIDGVQMSTVSLLLTRVLASSPNEGVSDRCIALLRSVRRKTFSWVQELSYDLAHAPTNEERRNLLLDMAVTCRSTFDVDPATLHKVFYSAEDVDALLSCIFFIHALRPDLERVCYYSRLLLERDSRLSPALEEILKDVILADVSDYGVDLAVGKIFAWYKPGTHRWEQLRCPNARWLTCESDATMEQSSQTVHINLLDGVLRVKGQPLNGLPHDVREIFCDQGFCVISSNLPGMDFATLPMVSKHQVHFSLRDDNLVVRAWDNQRNEILELIPSSKLRGDLPPALLDGHVHWLNLSMKTIDIRPLEQLWEQSSDHWRIECASGLYCMYKGHEALIDIRSPTWEMVSKCFECLTSVDKSLLSLDDEDLQRQSRSLLITTSPVDSVQSASMQRLSVTMPRYGLSFFVNEREELESCDFKDMVYDEDQCVVIARTLVLEALIPRRVLVPSGSFRSHGNHQDRIHIVPFAHDPFNQKLNEPSYYTYDVDTELGCLIGDGTLTSTRHLAYLHAMTSCYRPDPLTGKMGTEAALSLLRSATCRSTMELKSFQNSSVWISTQYPQINAAYEEILKGYYWNPNSHRLGKVNSVPEKRAARRAAYLFPSNAAGPTSLEDDDDNKYLTNNLPAEPGLATPPHSIASFNECLPRQIALGQLLCNRPVPELPARGALLRESHNTSSNDIPLLNQLLFSLRPHSSFQRKYLTHLEASAQCIRVVSQMTHKVASENRIEVLRKYYVQCRVNYLDSLKILQTSLGSTPTDPHEQGKVLNQFGHWPPITADVLLRHLASASLIDIPPHWKKCLISLALLLLDLQRSRRLLRFALDGLEDDFFKELENEGCDGWNPEEYPDWLLIQIQGNFLIRRTQAEAAMEIMSPRSGENTVMQVNMGEGKSSVIIPIAAAALADGPYTTCLSLVPPSTMVYINLC
ncbi:hypothetical protein HD554DRAFT_1702407 [Boletus coccyginus]|nr:hypothetical protein HD554DRAFT_1702407 [Boletus coccyginus]